MAFTEQDLAAALAAREQCGSTAAAARALGIPRGTLRKRLEHAERMERAEPVARLSQLVSGHPLAHASGHPLAHASTPRLTREALNAALRPPNNCKVKQFRDTLDPGSRRVLDDALAYDRQDLSASGLRNMLLSAGFPDVDVPGVDAINNHRTGTRPCRCKG